MAWKNNTNPVSKESEMLESNKPLDIQEALRILLAEKAKREKDDKTKKYVWIAILVVVLYNTFVFVSMYRYFTSPAFLENAKYSVIQVMPKVTEELGKTAEKSGPILFEELKKQFEAYLPVLSDKLLAEYENLNKRAVEISRKEFEGVLNTEMGLQLTNLKLTNGAVLTQDQLDQLKGALVEGVDRTLSQVITKNVGEQLNMCIEGVNVVKQVGEDLHRATSDINVKLDSKSEIERKKIGFDIMRSFLDAVDSKQTGRIPEGMATPAPVAPAPVVAPVKKK